MELYLESRQVLVSEQVLKGLSCFTHGRVMVSLLGLLHQSFWYLFTGLTRVQVAAKLDYSVYSIYIYYKYHYY